MNATKHEPRNRRKIANCSAGATIASPPAQFQFTVSGDAMVQPFTTGKGIRKGLESRFRIQKGIRSIGWIMIVLSIGGIHLESEVNMRNSLVVQLVERQFYSIAKLLKGK